MLWKRWVIGLLLFTCGSLSAAYKFLPRLEFSLPQDSLPNSGLVWIRTTRRLKDKQYAIGRCNGTVVKKNKILTASHCVQNGAEVEVSFYPFEEFIPATVLSKGDANSTNGDWAILGAPTKDQVVWKLSNAKTDKFLARLGVIPIMIHEQTHTLSVVAAQARALLNGYAFGIVYPGESGTAVIDANGDIVGVVKAIFLEMQVQFPFFQYTPTAAFKEAVNR